MKEFKYIQVVTEKEISTVWLNRPEVHNALSIDLLKELIYCLNKLNNKPEIRIIIIRGMGKSFCSGADLSQMKHYSGKGILKNLKHSKLLAKCFHSIYKSNKPIISVVHGSAIAGGIGIMAACDLIISSDSAVFSVPETRLGLIPSTIMPYVLKRISQQHARILVYTAQKLNASEALNIGLVDFVFESAMLEERTGILLNEILKASPNALKESKRLIQECAGKPIDINLIQLTIKTLSRVKRSKEAKEGLLAYTEKRKPSWISTVNK